MFPALRGSLSIVSAIIASSRGCLTRLLNTIFTHIVISAFGAMGPSMVAFLKEVYGRANRQVPHVATASPEAHGTRW